MWIRNQKRGTLLNLDSNTIQIVWKNKTLQNWKYLLSTNLPDSMYYKLTYNGDKKEWYLDAYRKVENQCIREETMIAELKRRGLM